MSHQMTLWDMPNVISSQGLASGPTPCETQDGMMIAPFSPDPAHANLSARQAKAMGLMTSGTYGPPSTGLSPSADLQSSLESRLRVKLSMCGSTLCSLTWKLWVTPSGVFRFRLRASALRTSGTGISGWPTPTTRDHKDSGDLSKSMQRKDGKMRHDTLPRVLWLHTIGTGSPSKEQMESFASSAPSLARQIMGLPEGWDVCAVTAMRSMPKRRKPSLRQ